MQRHKPDMIIVLVIVFGLSLVLSGFTSQHDHRESSSAKAAVAAVNMSSSLVSTD
ncbi:hypothetical protein [Gynuella sp.]|uniref:hypothetical protein n=1 Tax=Gynuella sp. TaxID=2969146 RepID=UPI003D0EC3E0